jgi:hypothetical protein
MLRFMLQQPRSIKGFAGSAARSYKYLKIFRDYEARSGLQAKSPDFCSINAAENAAA